MWIVVDMGKIYKGNFVRFFQNFKIHELNVNKHKEIWQNFKRNYAKFSKKFKNFFKKVDLNFNFLFNSLPKLTKLSQEPKHAKSFFLLSVFFHQKYTPRMKSKQKKAKIK